MLLYVLLCFSIVVNVAFYQKKIIKKRYVFIFLISLFDDINQSNTELVIRNCQWNCMIKTQYTRIMRYTRIMLKVNNKNNRAASEVVLLSILLTLNINHAFL